MKKIPIEIGKRYEMEIYDLSHDGLGIANFDGFLVFVKDALPSERVIAEISRVKKNYAHAQTVTKIKVATNRIAPLCELFASCGGCQMQHLDYLSQLKFKKALIGRNMQKFAQLENPPIADVIGMENPWRYRNKTQIPFGTNKQNQLVAGFYKNRSHEIIEMPACHIQSEIADEIIAEIKKLAVEFKIAPYHEATHTGILRQVIIRVGFKTKQIMVIFVTKVPDLPHKEALCQRLITKFPMIKSIISNVNSQVTNVIFGSKLTTIYGEAEIIDELGGLKFLISARSFYQVNPRQTEILYKLVVDYANLSADEVVFDAYCGIGTITLFLARVAKQVYGVEIVCDAISNAIANARINDIHNVNFEVGKAEIVIPRLISDGIIPDVIVVDPPRKGCDVALLTAIITAKPSRVVYVSCDSATLARDVKILETGGYSLKALQPVDMFAQTSHVECVALMSRKN